MPIEKKPPRQWAAEIFVLKTLAERRAALAQVPEHMRALVETHLTIAWERKRHAARNKANALLQQPAQ